MKWRVFYCDGSSFSSEDGDPADAPGSGVVGIGQEDEVVGVIPHSGSHFYVFDLDLYGGWYGVDYFGLAQYIARPGLKIIKLGETMDTPRYQAFLESLREDPLLPEKSARYPWERR